VALGLVDSLGRPGGRVTGVPAEVGGGVTVKGLEYLKEAAPSVSRVGILHDANFANPLVTRRRPELEALGLETQLLSVRDANELRSAFDRAVQGGVDGLWFVGTPSLAPSTAQIVALADQYHLPAGSQTREFADAGGLLAYGPNLLALNRRAAHYVDRIL